jgi:hypothetical protein
MTHSLLSKNQSRRGLLAGLLLTLVAVALLWNHSFNPPAQAGAAFATITVNSTADGTLAALNSNGTCDLREAIINANNNDQSGSTQCPPGAAGLDTIQFNLGAGTPSIAIAAALPEITEALTINGNTGGATRVELDGSGTQAVAGLSIGSTGVTVRSLVINRFTGDPGIGIRITADGAIVENCIIGLDATGTTAQLNSIGIDIRSANNTIGGTTASARNIISGNGVGIFIGGGFSNTVQGNYIGTDITGTLDRGNSMSGVELQTNFNTIGGSSAAARNLISGNDGNGVLFTVGANVNQVQGNFIGTQVNGTSALGNGENGVRILSSSNDIGGTVAGNGNTIAFNADHGVLIESGVGNAVLGNAIFGNGGLGINLGDSDGGVTPNDLSDSDSGANGLQNFPVLNSATIGSGGVVVINGRLDTTPSTSVRIEFFSNPTCDGSGNGEGQVFLGFTDVTTDAEGGATISVTLSASVTPGHFITATATTSTVPFNTSEFSACRVSYSGAVFVETFEGGIPPTWTVVDGGDDGVTWTTLNPCGQVIPPPFSGTFAIVDAGCAAPGVILDEYLYLPAFNATGLGSVYVEFFNQFYSPAGMQTTTGDVDVSIDGGFNWVNVLRLQSDDGVPTPNVKSIDITSVIAANPSNVLVRLHYYGNSGTSLRASPNRDKRYWAIDFSIYSYALNRTSQSFAANGGTGTVTVATSPNVPNPQGQWAATSNASWIHVTSNSPVVGNGMVSYTVDSHSGNTPRSGTITIAGNTFTVLQGAQFGDVPLNHPFYAEIGKLSARGITLGCTPTSFCPNANTTREQAAIFIERALGVFTPPLGPATPTFQDVPNSGVTDYGYEFIEDFVKREITQGCAVGPPRLYCPTASVTREQVAIFLLRALGVSTPPAGPATPTFADVPNSGATDYSHEFIEELYRRGITQGCAAGPPRLYCPTAAITRGQMAVFLVRAFNL